ncbi:MAG: NifB/NifX family molybdenum-iron cluster-binding protein, partial [Desulfarculaceae bacterium]
HLPIAPRALARVRYSPERSLSRELTPEQALKWLEYLAHKGETIKTVNLKGPGDPLATPETTLRTLAMLRETYPDLSIRLTTLGMGAAAVASKLVRYDLAHVSLLMDAVDVAAAKKVYAWIRPGTRTLPLDQGVQVLIAEQTDAVAALSAQGILVQIKTTVYPGINSGQVRAIAKKAAKLGASEMRLFPFLAKGEDCPQPPEILTPDDLEALARKAAQYLPARAMAPADCPKETGFGLDNPGTVPAVPLKPSEQRPHLAVCSSDGFEVDLHLGLASQYLIYGCKDGPVVLLETRPAPEPGGGDARWKQVALALNDCFAVIAAAVGEAPKRVLAEKGLPVLIQEGNLEGLVDVLFGGGKKGGKKSPHGPETTLAE